MTTWTPSDLIAHLVALAREGAGRNDALIGGLHPAARGTLLRLLAHPDSEDHHRNMARSALGS